MTCIHDLDEILKFQRDMFLKGFQIYQNYLCALTSEYVQDDFVVADFILVDFSF